jgi:uncharacterized protein (DUF1330 family)
MSAYCFFDVREITDRAKVDQYLAGVFATVEQYGGHYLVFGGKFDRVEGNWQPVYPVIVEFADIGQAQRWYRSPEYEPLKALRLAGTRSNAVFLEGATPESIPVTGRARSEGNARSPADIYDALFVPALFRQWGPVIAAEAGIGIGDSVIDVGCGTGVLALAALDLVGPEGKVVGLDPNPDMLDVARSKSPRIDWRAGRAEEIPFADASFDAAVSQFAPRKRLAGNDARAQARRPPRCHGLRGTRRFAGLCRVGGHVAAAVRKRGGRCVPRTVHTRQCRDPPQFVQRSRH